MKGITKELLEKHFSGQCTPEEERSVQQYFREGNTDLLEAYINEVEKLTHADTVPAELVDAELQLLYKKLEEPRIRKMFPVKKFLVASAAAIIVLSLAITWFQKADHKQENSLIIVKNDLQGIRKIQMTDGSLIWLNAHATIAYSKNEFNQKNREVTIKGEAFFDVAHNPQKPFIVHAGELTTTVKGTAFNIEAYHQENNTRITLMRGKVEINAGGNAYTMSPGERVSYDNKVKNFDVRRIAAEGAPQWMSGLLVFDDLPMQHVLERMETYYNISITCTDKTLLEGKRIKGVYKRKSADEVLSKILFIQGLHLKKKANNQYVIEK